MYNKKAHVHFVGIGGIGMSGIAKVLQAQGYTISGCDLDIHQQSVNDLIMVGCSMHQGNNTPACHDNSIDVLVYTSMVAHDHPEVIAAQKRGIPTIPRALMLAELMRTKYSIAIAGAHGKTTTTSLISHILIEAHTDPTVIIGGHLKNISASARLGDGDFLVAEACESDRSLAKLHATLAIVTNIDLEHLETYRDIDDIKATFKQFLENLPFYGKAFLCIDDPHIQSLLPMPHLKIVKYGFHAATADLWAENIDLHADHSTFTVWKKDYDQPLGSITTTMPGRHNILNSLAAIAVALDVNIPFPAIAQALKNFRGIARRFSYHGTFKGAEVFDDYGHHPQEIINTLEVARRRAKKDLIVVFQPHRYIRTHKLWHQFIETFLKSPLEHLIITDIHAAGEQPIEGVTSQNLVNELKHLNPPFKVHYHHLEKNFKGIRTILEDIIQPHDLVLMLGAGKINQLAHDLVL
jgi:UDP-N-acetylmuramate--alanine ligase